MIYGYARVSSKEQCEERQVYELIKFGVPQKNIYIDKQSGKDFERKNYKNIRKKIKKNDLLIVKSIDMLATTGIGPMLII